MRERQRRRRRKIAKHLSSPVLIQKSRQIRKIPRQACLLWKSGEVHQVTPHLAVWVNPM